MGSDLFCLVKGSEKDGLGKLVGLNDEGVVVEYFNFPGINGRFCISVPKSSIQAKRLGRNTRVYTYNEIEDRWSVGRVREDDGEGVEVRLPGKVDLYFNYEHVFIRWKRPIKDPSVFLANFITETPQFAEARSGFLESYLLQRSSAFGISALLSSSIELEPHQIDVARRVLTDHSQRYLLADEVGLGKTIEAGIIIRQAVLDDLHGHRIVILVPPILVNQWRQELISRFGLRDFIDDSVQILPFEDVDTLRDELASVSLLVIDEAHHLANPDADEDTQKVYRLVCEVAQYTERLLLLSATPIQRNESGFLRMLHLLDPVVYPIGDLANFHSKIVNRQALAETVAALDPSNALFMEAALDDLLVRIPNDPQLSLLTQSLKEKLTEFPEEDDPEFCEAVRLLRAHISETYRLNRRILRNRRTQVSGLTPDRKGAQVWEVQSSIIERLESLVEDWRIAASLSLETKNAVHAKELELFYWHSMCSLLEDPGAFLHLLTERKQKIGHDERVSFPGESVLLDAVIRAIDKDTWVDARIARLYEGLLILSETTKAVIFCSSSETADEVFAKLNNKNIGLVRYKSYESTDAHTDDYLQTFLDNPLTRFMVCDRSAEEGINLQGGNKAVIHFDLPLNPNRIEQRIGRVDRYGSGTSVQSYILFDKGSQFQSAWFDILEKGWKVFNQSISSLQYLVDAELNGLSAILLKEGIEAFDRLFNRLAGATGLVATELKLIDQQDALERLTPVVEESLDDLFDVEGEWKKNRDAMMAWIVDALLFRKQYQPKNSNFSLVDDPFRFVYYPPDGNDPAPTLIPSAGFIDDFLGAIDFDAPGSRSTRPQSYLYVNHRPTAVKRGIRPLRYGTEFIEAIKSFSDIDTRGRSYAMWRQVFDQFTDGEIRLCFRFDFVIETNLDEAISVLIAEESQSEHYARTILSRRGFSLFSPRVMQIWLDEDGDELSQEFIQKFLHPRYAKNGENGYIDKNLDGPYLSAFRRMSPDIFANWEERCVRMRASALDIVVRKPELQEQQDRALRKAVVEDEIRYAQLTARIQALDGKEAEAERRQLDLEQALNSSLYRGIRTPSIRLDVIGAVFLTSQPISVLSNALERDE